MQNANKKLYRPPHSIPSIKPVSFLHLLLQRYLDQRPSKDRGIYRLNPAGDSRLFPRDHQLSIVNPRCKVGMGSILFLHEE